MIPLFGEFGLINPVFFISYKKDRKYMVYLNLTLNIAECY